MNNIESTTTANSKIDGVLFNDYQQNANLINSLKSHRSKLKARRLRARNSLYSSMGSYSVHLRKTRMHNKCMKTAKMKQSLRNNSCPILKPLSLSEKQHIIDAVKSADKLCKSEHFGKELDDGHIEFKWKLISPHPDRLQHLITQMTYRLGEGDGTCIYQIGIEDCGHPKGLSDDQLIESITTIFLMAKQLNASMSIEHIKQGTNGKVATLRCTVNAHSIEEEKRQFLNSDDIRLCVAGNANCGKSTLIGVLTRGKLDDGRGKLTFIHIHFTSLDFTY